MAPLYKRYVPPKTAAPAAQAVLPAITPSAPPLAKAPPKPAQNGEQQKRKRERTDEEVAERKAKKLRKKGIDPATVDLTERAVDEQTRSAVVETNAVEDADFVGDAPTAPVTAAQGEFSHIKDKKKRRRLEKEARKARIAAEKQAKAGAEEDGGDEPGAEQSVDAIAEESLAPSNGVVGAAEDGVVPDDEAQAPKKRKKRRKEERAEEETDTAVLDLPKAPAEAHEADADASEAKREQAYDSRLSRPKKRRHKLEAALEQPATEADANEDDTEHLKKHGSLITKFQKAQKLAENTPAQALDDEVQQQEALILRDLVPLPQPEKAPTPEFIPDANVLPPWLARPTVIADDKKSTFAELGLDARLSQHLSKLGFADALPVQQALIPLLLSPGTPGARYLPGAEPVVPDIAVGAPTGSGKTIAYLVPIIEALKSTADSGKLKALVVVPTRELVMQVAAVAESLAKGSKVKVGVATGTGSFSDEQARLIKRGRHHDPGQYHSLMAKARRLDNPPLQPNDTELGEVRNFEEYLDEIEDLGKKEQQLIQDTISELPDHVPAYDSAVDILVATPGRLLEHLDNTLGFTLAYIEWLVLDEADKLLDGQYSNFLSVINTDLQRPHSEEEQDAREHYLRANGRWKEEAERRVRKVILSATMTRDVSKLMDLKLKRPHMLLVRGKGDPEQLGDGEQDETANFELPPTLREYSAHAGDGSEKPLYLLQILNDHILGSSSVATKPPKMRKAASVTSDSDSDSSSDSNDSSEMSDPGSDTSDSSEGEAEDPKPRADLSALHPARAAALEQERTTPTTLIFTSSTESATRLSHLLSSLATNQNLSILTLTSTTTAKALTRTLSSSPATQPVVAITTDRAARGLDALGSRTVTHVVQYDVPRSATNYVHRVGRTARAGRTGEAWTLFTHSEARWFVGEVVRNAGIARRGGGVEKVKVTVGGGQDDGGEGMRERFARAVEGLRGDVLGKGKGGSR